MDLVLPSQRFRPNPLGEAARLCKPHSTEEREREREREREKSNKKAKTEKSPREMIKENQT